MTYGLYSGMPAWVGLVTGVIYGLVLSLPFIADKYIKHRGFVGTLTFPCAFVTTEYLLSLTPAHSWFSLAYTQYEFPALIQVASITGMWGISFLIAWFASTVNWAWECDFKLSQTKKGLVIYSTVLILVLLFGVAYLAIFPPDSDTVRVAAITRSMDVDKQTAFCIENYKAERLSKCHLDKNRNTLDEFLHESTRAVSQGAQIIVWQENGLTTRQADEMAYVEESRQFAIYNQVYLFMGAKISTKRESDDENKVIVITPSGDVSEYLKNYLTPGDRHILGDGEIFVQETDYGKLATIICQDTHVLNFVRQAADVDIILIPNHNWESITPYVARMPVYRAIEHGFNMLRADYHGLSNAVDYQGRTLAEMNAFTSQERIMLTDIPTKGIDTIYSVIGDLFCWLSILGLLVIIFLKPPGFGVMRQTVIRVKHFACPDEHHNVKSRSLSLLVMMN